MSTHCYQPNRDRHTSQRHRVIERIRYDRSFPSKMACARPVRDFQKTIFTWRVPIWSNLNIVVVGDLNLLFQLARGFFRDDGDTIYLSGNETPASNFFLEYSIIFPSWSWSWRARRGRWKETNGVLLLCTDEQRTECDKDAFYSCMHFEFVLTLFHLFFDSIIVAVSFLLEDFDTKHKCEGCHREEMWLRRKRWQYGK